MVADDSDSGRPQPHRSGKSFGRIVLVSCYELGRQPLGIASPLGFLKRAGYAATAVDLAVDPLDLSDFGQAAFVGFSVPMHTALRLGTEAARRVREAYPRAHICFFGLYAGLNASYLLEHVADSVIPGEYEESLIRLVQALESGSADPVDGVSLPGRETAPYLKHLHFVPPDRSSLPPLDRYAQLEEGANRRLAAAVEASRGCRHLCRHCPIPPVYKGKFFLVPKEVVLEDIRGVMASGATHITFGDPDFLNGPNHSLRIAREMHRAFPQATFDFTAKIEHVLSHRRLFPELRACGAVFMISAVESFNDVILRHLDKGHTRQDIFEALKILRESKIALRPSLVAFTPWTTMEDYIDILEIVEREGLIQHIDPVHYTVRLLVPPGSYLLDLPAMKEHLGRLNEASFYYEWTHPDPRMDRLHKDASRIVEDAAGNNEDPFITFYRLKELAAAVREGRLPRSFIPPKPPSGDRPPRLTESWFCCAEPTGSQFGHLSGV